MNTDIQIAQEATLLPITEIAKSCNIDEKYLEPYGKYKAKINIDILKDYQKKTTGKLILVTAISPTKAGEGKTTVSIGLTQSFCHLGYNAIAALREPSLGPVFGIKGGATGGGYSQVLPMEDINLHFTGDMHAVSSAHNLIASAIENYIFHSDELSSSIKNIVWKRAIDINDRSLRKIIVNGRESSFQITASSEIMAVLCLADSFKDLRDRISKIVVAYTTDEQTITVEQLGITGAVCTLLKDAICPNIVQTIENTPVFIHGGPFANIAHGCSSLIATKMALSLSDYTITEAGFGADLGAEKFLNIKCRQGNLHPDVVVLVATIRALKYHGYAEDYTVENIPALKEGFAHLKQHVENLQLFNIPIVIAINKFPTDTNSEIQMLIDFCNSINIPVELCTIFENGGRGGVELVKTVIKEIENKPSKYAPLYPLDISLKEKIATIVHKIYRAKNIIYTPEAEIEIQKLTHLHLPICISKTPSSFSDNAKLRGCPKDFDFTIQSVRVAMGAKYIIVMAGNIIDMPGLSKSPAMLRIDIDDEGIISGLS